MILLVAVIVGLAAGIIRAWIGKRPYRTPQLRLPALVFFAFLPQLVAFYLYRAGVRVPDSWIPVILVSSQLVLLAFVWLNRKLPGFWIMGAGLLMNFLVISLNGGMMPISPETVQKNYPNASPGSWQVGKRLANGKDIVMQVADTRLWFLSDRFIFPGWIPYKVAFSAGDVLIAAGVFWLLWTLGGLEDTQAV